MSRVHRATLSELSWISIFDEEDASSSTVALGSMPRSIGPYRLVRPLRAGGQGTVYRGETRHGCAVAVKVFNAPFPAREKLLDEGRLIGEVAQPGVCPLLDLDWFGERPYMVMPLLSGPDLRTLCCSGAPLNASRLTALFERLAWTLNGLHRRGVMHGDIKPRNVVVSPGDQPVLIDFGLATSWRRGSPLLRGGTVGYVAPEVATSPLSLACPAIDLWSLGVTMHECLLGRRPDPDGELPSNLPPGVRSVLSGLLHPDPQRRPPAGVVARVLASAASHPRREAG